MGDKVFKWYVSDSVDAEFFHSKHETRDEAEKEGYAAYGDDPFVLIEADKMVVKPNFDIDGVVERILENLEEYNIECWSEDGPEDAWGEIKPLEQALEKAVADWLLAHPPRTFCVDEFRTVEHFNARPSGDPIETKGQADE